MSFVTWRGEELPDAETATARAFHYVREIAAADVRAGRLTQSHSIRIEGPHGEDIGNITFDEAVAISD
ncbi:MAG TPA: hypothetical protein VEC11_01295 [Allosphingosinicella sp.]|nr:hypothetical protein [Allosphingosinicella sp.]